MVLVCIKLSVLQLSILKYGEIQIKCGNSMIPEKVEGSIQNAQIIRMYTEAYQNRIY